MFERKTQQIEIAGFTLILSERNYGDVERLDKFKNENSENDSLEELFLKSLCIMISDSIKVQIQQLKWYQFSKKRLIKKFSIVFIYKKLTPRQIFSLSAIIQSLEGNDNTYLRLLAGELSEDEKEKYLETIKAQEGAEELRESLGKKKVDQSAIVN